MPGMMWEADEFSRPFYIPWLAIIGDFDLQIVYDYFGATQSTSGATWVTWDVVVAVLLWLYTAFVTIVLVNLLIAQVVHPLHIVVHPLHIAEHPLRSCWSTCSSRR